MNTSTAPLAATALPAIEASPSYWAGVRQRLVS